MIRLAIFAAVVSISQTAAACVAGQHEENIQTPRPCAIGRLVTRCGWNVQMQCIPDKQQSPAGIIPVPVAPQQEVK